MYEKLFTRLDPCILPPRGVDPETFTDPDPEQVCVVFLFKNLLNSDLALVVNKDKFVWNQKMFTDLQIRKLFVL